MEKVILVNTKDQETGTMEKMEAHEKGVLHRAFSVLIFNSKGELLLQKRASEKYHSGGLWTNTCCSHPRPGEPVEEAAKRRLKEEMGMDVQPEFLYKFIYKTKLDQGLTEHELDHVYIGVSDNDPNINKTEVEDWKYLDFQTLKADMVANHDNYTSWFQIIIDHVEPYLIRQEILKSSIS